MLVMAIGMIAQAQDEPKKKDKKKERAKIEKSDISDTLAVEEKSAGKEEGKKGLPQDATSPSSVSENGSLPKPVAMSPSEAKSEISETGNNLPKPVAVSPAEKGQTQISETGNLPKKVALSPGEKSEIQEVRNLPKNVALSPPDKEEETQQEVRNLPKNVALAPSDKEEENEKVAKTLPMAIVLDPEYSLSGEDEMVSVSQSQGYSFPGPGNTRDNEAVSQSYSFPGNTSSDGNKSDTYITNNYYDRDGSPSDTKPKQDYYRNFRRPVEYHYSNYELELERMRALRIQQSYSNLNYGYGGYVSFQSTPLVYRSYANTNCHAPVKKCSR